MTALVKLSDAEMAEDGALRALSDAVGHATDRYRTGLASHFEVSMPSSRSIRLRTRWRRSGAIGAYVQVYSVFGGCWKVKDSEWVGAR